MKALFSDQLPSQRTNWTELNFSVMKLFLATQWVLNPTPEPFLLIFVSSLSFLYSARQSRVTFTGKVIILEKHLTQRESIYGLPCFTLLSRSAVQSAWRQIETNRTGLMEFPLPSSWLIGGWRNSLQVQYRHLADWTVEQQFGGRKKEKENSKFSLLTLFLSLLT